MAEQEIGRISHYFGHIGVAAIELTKGTLAVGDTIHIKGHTSDIQTYVESMQIEHESIREATVGESIGIKVPQHVRVHDVVYKMV